VKFPKPTKSMDNGCIIIDDGAQSKKGYRAINWLGQQWGAHRLSYSLNVEKIPVSPSSRKHGLVLHQCDNPPCINPDHLHLGDAAKNMLERSQRCTDLSQRISEGRSGIGHSEASRAKMSRSQKLRFSRMNQAQRSASTSKARAAVQRKKHQNG